MFHVANPLAFDGAPNSSHGPRGPWPHASVVNVNPGGTGSPMEAISAKFAPAGSGALVGETWSDTVEQMTKRSIDPRIMIRVII